MWQTVTAAHTSCWMEFFCSAFRSFKTCSSKSTLCENDSPVHTVLQSPRHIPQVCISHMLRVQRNMLFNINGLPKRALLGKKSSYRGDSFSSRPMNGVPWRLLLPSNCSHLQHYTVTPPLVEFKRSSRQNPNQADILSLWRQNLVCWVLLFSTDFYS